MFEVIVWYMTPKCQHISAQPNDLLRYCHTGQSNMHEWIEKHPANLDKDYI